MGHNKERVEPADEIKGSSIARMIRKYSNRRLYDMAESRYICLEDIRKLVSNRIEFSVIDADSTTDITRSILLQALVEQEELAEPVLSREFLLSTILACHADQDNELGAYLEQSLKVFLARQRSDGAQGE